jgi:hypothetical protein
MNVFKLWKHLADGGLVRYVGSNGIATGSTFNLKQVLSDKNFSSDQRLLGEWIAVEKKASTKKGRKKPWCVSVENTSLYDIEEIMIDIRSKLDVGRSFTISVVYTDDK